MTGLEKARAVQKAVEKDGVSISIGTRGIELRPASLVTSEHRHLVLENRGSILNLLIPPFARGLSHHEWLMREINRIHRDYRIEMERREREEALRGR